MHGPGRAPNFPRPSTHSLFRSLVSLLLLAMFATMASVYVAARLCQDAEDTIYLSKELDRRTGQGQYSVSVEDTLKVITCREQQKKLSSLEKELVAARKEGFASKYSFQKNGVDPKRKLLAVVGIVTTFGHKKNRDAIRKAWMTTGNALKKLEDEKGVIVRFVIGRSANHRDSSDVEIDGENRQTRDFVILDDHVEKPGELLKKTKLFFRHAAEKWDADFYAKVNDDVYVNIDALAATLATHLDKPRVYIGCMKSGEVFSDPTDKWHETGGDSVKKNRKYQNLFTWLPGLFYGYFWHASGEIYAISQALAQHISINSHILSTYAHDDVSAGSWFIGLDVNHVDEEKFCCSSWNPGAICVSA